jgi:hypothetical protein
VPWRRFRDPGTPQLTKPRAHELTTEGRGSRWRWARAGQGTRCSVCARGLPRRARGASRRVGARRPDRGRGSGGSAARSSPMSPTRRASARRSAASRTRWALPRCSSTTPQRSSSGDSGAFDRQLRAGVAGELSRRVPLGPGRPAGHAPGVGVAPSSSRGRRHRCGAARTSPESPSASLVFAPWPSRSLASSARRGSMWRTWSSTDRSIRRGYGRGSRGAIRKRSWIPWRLRKPTGACTPRTRAPGARRSTCDRRSRSSSPRPVHDARRGVATLSAPCGDTLPGLSLASA